MPWCVAMCAVAGPAPRPAHTALCGDTPAPSGVSTEHATWNDNLWRSDPPFDGIYGRHSSSGLTPGAPAPHKNPHRPRWFFGGAGRTPQYSRHRNFDIVKNFPFDIVKTIPAATPWASAARSSEASLVARSHHSCVLSPCPHSAGGLWCRRSVPCCPASPGSSCRAGYLRPQDPGAFDGSVLPLPQFVLLRDPASTDSDLRAVGSTVVGLAAVQLHCLQGLLRLVLYGVPDGP